MDASHDNKLIQNIFRAHAPRLRASRLPIKHRKAIDAITTCRTAERGTSVYRCEAEGSVKSVHHSCRHRSCWLCAQRRRHQWVEAQSERLLDCGHFHVVFTLPAEYRTLWRFNRRWFVEALFATASSTLLELMKDERHQGVTPGIVMALHTWGRQLALHPHVHCVVTGGGLDRGGRWKSSGEYLLPVAVVKALYRGRLQARVKDAFEAGELSLPPDWDEDRFRRCYRQAYRKPWAVRIEPRYVHGRGVLKYLARYLRGGPLSPRQIVRCDARRIGFRYKDHRDGRRKVLELRPEEFTRRLLEHVPEDGQHGVRHYGLYGSAAREKRNRCRESVGGLSEVRLGERPRPVGPICRCGAPLVLLLRVRGRRSRKANSNGMGHARARASSDERFVQQVDEPDTASAEKRSLRLRL